MILADVQSLRIATRNPHIFGAKTVGRETAAFTETNHSNDGSYNISKLYY